MKILRALKAWILGIDLDKNGTPDVEQVKAAAKEAKRRAKRVKEEAEDVVDAVKEVGSQLKDIPSAAKGKARSGRKKK